MHAYVIPISSSTERGVLDLFTGLLLAAWLLSPVPALKAEVSVPVAIEGLTYQVAENLRGFSVLSRILEEGSANSY